MNRFKTSSIFITLTTLLYTPLIWAQGIDVDIDLDGNDTPAIFENPLFWVGVAVVVIVVAIVLRGKK